MPHINLLPWREAQRAERQRQFVVVAAGAAIMMALAVVFVHIQINAQIENQNGRNKFLQDTIAKVDEEIAEIKTLQEDKKALLARMNIIQRLQRSRPEIVHLFEEMAKTIPKGVYLDSFSRSGKEISLTGKANSNDSISAFMRQLDASQWLTNPRLSIIQTSKSKGSGSTSSFKLQVQQTEPASKEKEAGA